MRKEVLAGLIMAYLIVSDKQIHSKEMDILEDYWQKHKFSKDEKELCFAILGDRDEKIPLNGLLVEIGKADFKDKEKLQFITTLCEIAVYDMHIDASETEIIEKAAKKIHFKDPKNILQAVYKKAKETKEADESRERPEIDTIWFRIRAFFSFGKKREEMKRMINRFILQGPKYGEAIRSGAAIAKSDMAFIERIINENKKTAEKCLETARKSLKNSVENNASKEAQELHKNISGFIGVLEEKVIHAVKENMEVLNRKQRAMNYFTISFLGKTKAGKSTLHTVMTGGGSAFIGKGSQRTTRFNRVYEWDNIRIIDTPGIGAAEAGGRTDEEIARSVIDETDVLCYVVTSDNIQQVEFNFMESIRSKNKPIVILLNVKNDFTRLEAMFKEFIRNPHYWAERKDEQNIQGHINRIVGYVSKLEDFNADFIKIIPVHLLAAFVSTEEKKQEYKIKLIEGSHLDDFLDYIRESIIESITLRRSQTIIDGTTHYINSNLEDIRKIHTHYAEFTGKVNEKKEILLKKINNDKQKITKNCLQDIDTLFEKFMEQINKFAENNYGLKKKALENAWTTYAKTTMKIESRIDNVIRKTLEQEQKDIQDYISDLILDMNSFFTYKGTELSARNFPYMKRVFSIFGTALGAAGGIVLFVLGVSNPVGWILTAAGLIVGLLATLFKNKAKKRQEAIEKLSGSLQKSMNDYKTKVVKQIPQIIKNDLKKMSLKIEELLSQIQSGARTIEKRSLVLLNKYKKSFDEANRYYAKRICDFCSDNIKTELEHDDYSGIKVKRNYGKEIQIQTDTIF
jgi:predicted GTPase/uncharacterized tellurite resistance protein B-like protein/uncharacterized membrane-anchored protein YhcB (DUF1043 family)